MRPTEQERETEQLPGTGPGEGSSRAPATRLDVARELALCFHSFPYFARRYVRTLNLDVRPAAVAPLPDFPFVDRVIAELAPGDDLLFEKSRQMLISWLVMAKFAWGLLFDPSSSRVAISRAQEYVDDGGEHSTPDSLLGKVRFIVGHLPAWFSPREAVRFKYRKITSELSSASISGETTTRSAGRGPAYSEALLDEAAFIPRSEVIFGGLRPACPRGVIVCSSPNGRLNVHGRLRWSKTPTGFRLVRVHWREHPLRDEAWYARVTAGMLPSRVASEYELSYLESVSGSVLPISPEQLGAYPYDPALPIIASWDFGWGDETVCFLWQRTATDARIIDGVHGSGTTAAEYDERLRALRDPVTGRPYPLPEREWADPSGTAHNSSGGSWVSDLVDLGRTVVPVSPIEFEENGRRVRRRDKVREIELVRVRLLPILRINDGVPFGAAAAEALSSWHLPTDDEGRPTSYVPVHDYASHWGDAATYFSMGELGARAFSYADFERIAELEDVRSGLLDFGVASRRREYRGEP
jgi:hypothetical protein